MKKICDKQKDIAVAKASEEAENRGIQEGVKQGSDFIKEHRIVLDAPYLSVKADSNKDEEDIVEGAGSTNRAVSEPNRGISEGVSPDCEVYVVKDVGNTYFGDMTQAQEQALAESEFPSDEEDINDYDLTIDDKEATDEASDFSQTHAEYVEMLKKYNEMHGEIPPMVISHEQFDNEHIFEKRYVNWYAEDDVFTMLNDSKVDDPYYYFGYTSGRDLFAPEKVDNREDPNIVYIRNFKESVDYEITRMPGNYSQLIKDGEIYYHGETDSGY